MQPAPQLVMSSIHAPHDELLNDYRWLVSDEATPYLDRAAGLADDVVKAAQTLRRELSAQRTHLVIEQVELRRRAAAKFELADRMFFTRQALEQATDRLIAGYVAKRFPPGQPVADLCCGLGGNLLSLANRGPTAGVESDPVVSLLAAHNCRVAGFSSVRVFSADAASWPVADLAAWHIDPDRRAGSGRTTNVEYFEPPRSALERLLAANGHAAIKLAPATTAPQAWADRCELNWVGVADECKQQIAWFGPLALEPGRPAATIVRADGAERTIVGTAGLPTPAAPAIGRYLFEPHAVVLAANLAGSLAADCRIAAITSGIAYLTGDHPIDDPALASFEVTDVLPLDLKRLSQLLRQRKIGQLEIKKRGVAIDPQILRAKIHLRGDGQATLIVLKYRGHVTAVIATRCASLSRLGSRYLSLAEGAGAVCFDRESPMRKLGTCQAAADT